MESSTRVDRGGNTGAASGLRSSRFVAAVISGALLVAGGASVGCNNAGEGAASGAALGALVGLGLGSLSGDMGKGAAAGALIGGAGGAILGDQNRRADERARPRHHDPYGYGGGHSRY